MKNIYTVIIIGGRLELSTASFTDFDEAVAYCCEEIQDANQLDGVSDRIVEKLSTEMYYDDNGTKYYIEEAKLDYFN